MKTNYLTLAALAFIMAACNNDNVIHPPVAARFSAEIYDATLTRASGASWENGDKIGISATGNVGMSSLYTNVEYTTISGDGNFTGTQIYFQNANDVTFTAYYPYNATVGTLENSTRAKNQKTDTQKTIDYMFASVEGVNKSNPTVTFLFKHKMSQITLTFIKGDGVSFTGKTISYSLVGLQMTGEFNTSDGTATATKDAETLTISGVSLSEPSTIAAPVILYPQTISGSQITLSVVLDEKTYSCALTTDNAGDQETLTTLEAGKNYQFTVTVSKTGLSVGSSSITDWIPVTGSGTAEI